MAEERWRRCSSCKSDIGFRTTYWVCNVSTCNRKRTGLVFCKVACWDAHLGFVRHRESWALEKRSPSREEWRREQAAQAAAPPAPRSDPPPKRAPDGASALFPEEPEEREAPARGSDRPPRRRLPPPSPGAPSASRAQAGTGGGLGPPPDDLPHDVLIVASKLKQFVKARAGISTSDRVLEPLSNAVRALCEEAIERALEDERKTLLDRDFPVEYRK